MELTPMSITLIVFLVSYIFLLFFISLVFAKKQSDEDFLIAGRNRKGWQILLSKFASSIGAGYFITYTGFAYQYGMGVFTMLLGIIVGFLVFAYWAAPRIAEHARKEKFYSIGDFVYSRTKSVFAKMTANILSCVILFGWLVVGIIGSAKIIEDFGVFSYNYAVIVTSVVVLLCLLIGGYRAVIFMDTIHSVIIFVLMCIITYNIVGTSEYIILHTVHFETLNIEAAIGFFLFGVLTVFSFADRYQLAYSAKNVKALTRGLGFAIIPVVIIAYFLLLIGIFMANQGAGLDPGLVFTEAIKNFLHPALVPFAIILFFAGIMSASDNGIYAISSHYAVSRDTKNRIFNVRVAIVVITALVAGIALAIPNIVEVSLISAAMSLLLSWGMIYIIAGGNNVYRFIGSIIGAFVGFIIGLLMVGIDPIASLPLIICGLVGLIYTGPSKKKKKK